MAAPGWKVVNSQEMWALARAYLNDIDRRQFAIKDHPNRYFEAMTYRAWALQAKGLLKRIVDELTFGNLDPTTLPPASKLVYYQGTTILKPIDLSKPDYRRLSVGEFSALYRLIYSERPHVCFGVAIFLREDEPENLELALEAQYQQMIKRISG